VAYVAGYDVAMIKIELSFYLLIIATSYPATYATAGESPNYVCLVYIPFASKLLQLR
jgi:hypothetical protein